MVFHFVSQNSSFNSQINCWDFSPGLNPHSHIQLFKGWRDYKEPQGGATSCRILSQMFSCCFKNKKYTDYVFLYLSKILILAFLLNPLGDNKTDKSFTSHAPPVIPNVIHPCKPSSYFRATCMTSFTTSFSTTDCDTAASWRFQGMQTLPTFCQKGRAQRSTHPGHSRKQCWFPQTGTAERSWPTRCCQRTGRNSWCKRSRWSPLGVDKRREKECCMNKKTIPA